MTLSINGTGTGQGAWFGRRAGTTLDDELHTLEPGTLRPGSAAFRLFVVSWVLGLLGGVLLLRSILWTRHEGGVVDVVQNVLGIFWVLQFFSAVTGLVGLMWPRRASTTTLTQLEEQMNGRLVSFRIVTRGVNVEALRATVSSVEREMTLQRLFDYVIELATDCYIEGLADDVVQLVTPSDYQTASGARFKARALNYALLASAIPQDAWIFHLDEESQVTASVVRGIAQAIVEEEQSGQLRIGQGAILYHRDFRRHPFLTLADTLRTGEDLGRYFLQQRIGRSIFGLHGSFILARNDVESAVGFDLGPQGSITEDAWWALLEMNLGTRTRWVDGFVVEQSTQSVMDFVKQRRRWFLGLMRVVLFAPVTLRHKGYLTALVLVWATMPIAVFAVLFQLVTSSDPHGAFFLFGAASFAIFATHYCVGLQLNMQHHRVRHGWRRLALYVAQVILLPVFALIETFALLYAFAKPSYDFHVVKK